MARTGSSAITRLLDLLGVELGPDDSLLAAQEHVNAKGFYEHREIMLLNNELLVRLGGTWDEPPALQPGWAEDPQLDDLRAEAREILVRSFTTRGPWGFKDPRTCFTLPFWRPLIGGARFVLCHRNPLEVAYSLEVRDEIPVARGIELWARYASAAALATVGTSRIVVSYEALFTRPRALLVDLARFVGVPDPMRSSDLVAASESWIDSELRHHEATMAEVLSHPDIAPDVRSLSLAYEIAARARSAPTPDRSVDDALDAAAAAVQARLARRRQIWLVGPPLAAGSQPHQAGSDVATTLAADLRDGPDFIVIGLAAEQLAGMLAAHPDIVVDGAGAGGLRGAIRPSYLVGEAGLHVDEIAYRIAAAHPEMRVIAVLDDPVAQAIGLHRQAAAHGQERRAVQRALRDQLRPLALAAARASPRPSTRYIVAGEYGRILGSYRSHLPASQLLVVTNSELASDPSAVASGLAAFLRVADNWRPEALPEPREAFPVPLDPTLDQALRAHFAADGERVPSATATRGQVPWAIRIPGVPRGGPRKQAVASLVVIVHDTPEEAAELVESVRRHTPEPYELLLVDNGSNPDCAARLEELAFDQGTAICRTGSNQRFGRACNFGVRRTVAEDVVLLNSDCRVTPNWLSNLRAALASASDIGAVGPRSNSAHLAQGGIWLDDTSPEGVERFARFFNHPDQARWFEVEWLVGFAMAIRRSAFDAVRGFSGKIRTGAGEDRDLCMRLGNAGYRLLCAGDTFVFHYGQRTYDVAGLSRTALRYGASAADPAAAAVTPSRLLRRSDGRVYEVAGSTGWHVETSAALRLIRGDRSVEDAPDAEIDRLRVGAPISLARAAGSDDVFVLHAGVRRAVAGDPHRIRRLPGLALTERGRLDQLPEGLPVNVEDAVAPVPELPSLLPSNPAKINPERLAGAEEVAQAVGSALQSGDGFALIRIGSREAVVLNDGVWPVMGADAVAARLDPEGPTAAQLRAAIIGADAVCVPDRRDSFPFAPLVEQLLFHLDLYPPLLCSWHVGYELLGVDPDTGSQGRDVPLLRQLAGHPVAVVGPLARDAGRYGTEVGLEVTVELNLRRFSQLDRVLMELGALRDLYDAVLVAAGPPSRVLCSRVARELGAVALDMGHGLGRLLYARHGIRSEVEISARWQAEQYLREALQPPLDPPHPLDGQLLRIRGERGVFYVERGRLRQVTHRALMPLLGGRPRDVEGETIAGLRTGMPVAAVHDRRGGLLLLIDGRRVPLRLGARVAAVDDLPLRVLPASDEVLAWFPGAEVPAVRGGANQRQVPGIRTPHRGSRPDEAS